MAEVKISGLPIANTVSKTDRLVVLANPGANASVKTFEISKLPIIVNTTPQSYTANGNPGDLTYDSNFLYVCVANNTWGRIKLDFVW